jgi:hypothetical protein
MTQTIRVTRMDEPDMFGVAIGETDAPPTFAEQCSYQDTLRHLVHTLLGQIPDLELDPYDLIPVFVRSLDQLAAGELGCQSISFTPIEPVNEYCSYCHTFGHLAGDCPEQPEVYR